MSENDSVGPNYLIRDSETATEGGTFFPVLKKALQQQQRRVCEMIPTGVTTQTPQASNH